MAATRKFANKAGARNGNVLRQVTAKRNAGNSWANIATDLGIAPRTARRIFQEKNGPGSHHGLLPGKGGRRPVAKAEVAA